MIDSFQWGILVCAILLSFAGSRWLAGDFRRIEWVRRVAAKRRVVAAAVGCATFLGCLAVVGVLHEPVPCSHDEFSYLLMSNTFASGHVANPAPPLPEFFDTFHVLVRPVYISKYYPAQGIFLAIGEKLTGHPAVGIWLGSALACVATCWMLQAWVGLVWGLVGGLLLMLQWGVYSYWSQSYYGGMVAAFGGALFFGALRRLWDGFSWRNAIWMGTGLVILVNSRPLEGLLAAGIGGTVFLVRVWRQRQWTNMAFWRQLAIPAGAVLLLGAAATLAYNHATTGSAFLPPYLEHERQYQVTPPFIFLGERPKITYSSPVLQNYYEGPERLAYESSRQFFPCALAQILKDWWFFYCGILFSLPLLIPVLLRRGWICGLQIALLAGFVLLPAGAYFDNMWAGSLVDLLVVVQVVLLWLVFDGVWPRLAISITAAMLLLGSVCKWWFPHYSAPAACMVWYLQIEGLCRMWHWRPQTGVEDRASRRRKRRESVGRSGTQTLGLALRYLVCLLPLACLLTLGARVAFRLHGGMDEEAVPEFRALVTDQNEWSLKRAALKRWLEGQSGPQLVFVRYAPAHNTLMEWVYNDADLPHSKVVWARDLGAEHNRLLLQQMPGRTVWSLETDRRDPQLVPYPESGALVSN
jgi:hypothetical protein